MIVVKGIEYMENLDKLIRELAAMKDEVQWLEFKHEVHTNLGII